MKLLIDMNMSPGWVKFLTLAQIEAEHWSKLGRYNAPDHEIMSYARFHDYVVLTHDLDFGAILAVTQGKKPSVIQIRADEMTPQAIGKQVIASILQLAAEIEDGALVSIEANTTRMHVLPLRRKEN